MNRQDYELISWTRWTSNPIFVIDRETGKRGWHCGRVGNGTHPSGCDNCYAASMNMGRFGTGLDFLPVNDDRVEWQINEKELALWVRMAPDRMFPFDMTDIFHTSIPRHMLVKCFAAMLLARWMTFQVLTKRVAQARRVLTDTAFQADVVNQALAYAQEWKVPFAYQNADGSPVTEIWKLFPLENMHLGVSISTMRDAARLGILQQIPAALHWISAEPQLELLSFREWFTVFPGLIGWVVQGGESGSDREGGRPVVAFEEDWARSMRDDCAGHGVSYHLKQMGAVWAKRSGVYAADSHGKNLRHIPADLRVRQFPTEIPTRPGGRKVAPARESVTA